MKRLARMAGALAAGLLALWLLAALLGERPAQAGPPMGGPFAFSQPGLTAFTRAWLLGADSGPAGLVRLGLTNRAGAVLVGNDTSAPEWTNTIALDTITVTNNTFLAQTNFVKSVIATNVTVRTTGPLNDALILSSPVTGGSTITNLVQQASVQTTDAAATSLYNYEVAKLTSTVFFLRADIVARCAATGEGAAYMLQSAFKVDGDGTLTVIGSPTTSLQVADDATWKVEFSIAGDVPQILVYGADGKTVRWHATVAIQPVGT